MAPVTSPNRQPTTPEDSPGKFRFSWLRQRRPTPAENLVVPLAIVGIRAKTAGGTGGPSRLIALV